MYLAHRETESEGHPAETESEGQWETMCGTMSKKNIIVSFFLLLVFVLGQWRIKINKLLALFLYLKKVISFLLTMSVCGRQTRACR